MNPIKLGKVVTTFDHPKDHRNSAATLRFYLFRAGPTFTAVTWWCVAWLPRGKNLSKHLGERLEVFLVGGLEVDGING